MTVGSGITPDLLTFPDDRKALAGLGRDPYRRWGVSPRPENNCAAYMKGEGKAVNGAKKSPAKMAGEG
jgi:hypothetical protein